ncbi:MAG: ABC transporter substrate-binding protein [Myxococcota bacterium]
MGRARAILILAVATVLAGCPEPPAGPRFEGAGHDQPRRGGTFTFHASSNVRGLDPHKAFDVYSIAGIRLIFDGLLDYDDEAHLVPSLLESMPDVSDDGLVYTFRLRPEVRFHNGRALTAQDVRWSLERMLHPDTASPGWSFFLSLRGLDAYREGKADHLEGIRVVDAHTLRIALKEPDQTFLNAMAMAFAYPVPREMYEHGAQQASERPIGTGPFRLVEWEKGVRLLFQRNDDYWRRGRPYVDHMVFLENVQPHLGAMRFQNADVEHSESFPLADYLHFKHAEGWKPYTVEQPEVTIYGVFMNTQMEPFDDVHVRRAVAHAIDRRRWARAKSHRIQPAGQVLPPRIVGYREDLPHLQRFDLDEAREEMRLAGYPDGLPEPVTVWVGESPASQASGELLQADLKKIGIDIVIKPVAFTVYLKESGKPGRVQMAFTGWSQDFPDPSDFLDVLFHSRQIHPDDSENRSFYSNPELDRLLDRARTEQDPDTRRQLYEEANDIVARDAPWAFLYYPLGFEAWQPYVKGYRPNPVWSHNYRGVWLDLPRKEAMQ